MQATLTTVGSLITVILGTVGIIAPTKIAQLVSIEPDGLTGIYEIRATYGGFFLGLGLASLYFDSQVLFTAMGIAWLSAALGRIVSVVGDRNTEIKNIFGILFEMAIGLLFVNNM